MIFQALSLIYTWHHGWDWNLFSTAKLLLPYSYLSPWESLPWWATAEDRDVRIVEFAVVKTRRIWVDIQNRTSYLLHYSVYCFLIFVPNAVVLTSPIQYLLYCVSENHSLSLTLPLTLLEPMITSLPFNTSFIFCLAFKRWSFFKKAITCSFRSPKGFTWKGYF